MHPFWLGSASQLSVDGLSGWPERLHGVDVVAYQGVASRYGLASPQCQIDRLCVAGALFQLLINGGFKRVWFAPHGAL